MSKGKWQGFSWFLWVPLIVAIDQISKWWAMMTLKPAEVFQVFPGLQFFLAENRGMAFSFLDKKDGTTSTLLLLIVTFVSLTIAVWLAKTPKSQKLTGWSLVCVLGGALGNIFDRIFHGYVVDFIDIYIGQWHWYTFNLADSFITVGAIVMIAEMLFSQENVSPCQNR